MSDITTAKPTLDYEDWVEKLIDPDVAHTEYAGILVDAYCCLHKQAKTKAVHAAIKALYDDFYYDPYFLLKIIFETMDLKIAGNRLGYIRVIASRKLGRV